MCLKLEELCKIYKNNKNKYIFDDAETIKYDWKDFDEYTINIKMIKVSDNYMVFVFIDSLKELLFMGLLKKSDFDLSDYYNKVKNDLRILSFEDFISKHYDELIKKEK